jgi:hypothetical protein
MTLRARSLPSFQESGASTGHVNVVNNRLSSAPVGTCVLLLLAFAHVTVAEDADVHDLQENLPVRVTDAFASSGPQVQARTLLSGERPSGFQAQLEPQVQWGFAPGWHVQTAAVMVTSSPEENTNSGDVQVLLFRQLNQLNGRRPVVAISVGADIPSGIDSAGLDARVRGIVTQPLGGAAQHRLHGNFEWLRNSERQEGERANAWLATAGYSRLLGPRGVIILDAARLQDRAVDEVMNLAEAGIRLRMSHRLVVSSGIGIGLGPNSPRVQFTFGVEQSF